MGARNIFPRSHNSSALAEYGVPVSVAGGGDLALALRYSNHSSADLYVDEITNKIRDDLKIGRPFVFPRGGGMYTGTACIAVGNNQIQYEIARGA